MIWCNQSKPLFSNITDSFNFAFRIGDDDEFQDANGAEANENHSESGGN